VVARPSRVVVVGGAVLDTKLRTRDAPVPGTSNPGVATHAVGGVGRNIAENLARLGTRTTLVAALGDDPAGTAVLERTSAAGVDCTHVVASALPTGSYTAVLDDAGDLVVAVSDMRATDELRVEDLEVVPALLAGAGALVVDANLPLRVLRRLLRTAVAAGVPVVAEPVSVAKAAVLGRALGEGNPVDLVTPNVDELAALVGGLGVGARSDAQVVQAAGRLHDRGVAVVWVRRGSRGSLLSVRDTSGRPAVHVVSAPKVEVVDVTGAGDSSTAGYVHAVLGGASTVDAVRFGQVCAALTCASPETVRSDLTLDLVLRRLTATDPLVEELVP
jgi:pseudouridine kinase